MQEVYRLQDVKYRRILAGASPLDSIRYQTVIMMDIMGSAALTVYPIIQLGCRGFFNERAQLDDQAE